MAINSVKDYKDNPRSLPADDINPELKKTKDFFRAYAEAMWSEYVSNRCAWGYYGDRPVDDEVSIDELRAYATGKQDIKKIKSHLLKEDPNTPGKYLSKNKISWKGYMIMPEMYDVIRSFNAKIDYDVNATAIDDDSIELKETDKEYIKYYLQEDVKNFMDRTGFQPQMKINPQEVGARTAADVDLLIDTGGFNLETEMAAQVVCNTTKKESYFAVIQDKCFDDIFSIGRAGLKSYVNKSKLTAELRRVDPKYAVVPHSRYADFRDVTRSGEVREMTIGDFRKETDLTDPQLMDLAKDYAGMNPTYEQLVNAEGYYNPEGARKDFIDTYGIDPLNDVRVLVLDFQFLSLDIQKYIENFNEGVRAGDRWKKVSYEYEISEKDAKRGDKLTIDQGYRKYEAKWIIGSDYFINYGKSEYVKYKGEDGNRMPVLDYHWTQTNNSSIVERCIEHIDDLNTNLFKKRAAIQSLPPAPRMIIEQGLLDSVVFNKKIQSPDDLIRAFEEKGVLIVNRRDVFDKPVNVSGKTIEFVPSGIIEDITLFSNEMLASINAIKAVTGVNDVVAAQTPQERTGLGVSKLAEVATSNALFPSFNAWKYAFEPAFEDIIGKWQMIVDDNEKSIAHVPLGANTIQVFKIGKQFAKSQFHLRIEMVIGESEKQMLLAEITNLKAARRQNGGQGGITGAQYLKIYDMIMAGNRKLAMFVLSQVERLQSEQDKLINEANQTATFNAQAKTAKDAETAKQNTYQVEGSVKANTALVTEASKRKTVLVQALVAPAPDGQTIDRSFIEQQIKACDEEIAQLLQIIHQEADIAKGGGQQPPAGQGQQPQQLQQAS